MLLIMWLETSWRITLTIDFQKSYGIDSCSKIASVVAVWKRGLDGCRIYQDEFWQANEGVNSILIREQFVYCSWWESAKQSE